jgi:hypothetical protein
MSSARRKQVEAQEAEEVKDLTVLNDLVADNVPVSAAAVIRAVRENFRVAQEEATTGERVAMKNVEISAAKRDHTAQNVRTEQVSPTAQNDRSVIEMKIVARENPTEQKNHSAIAMKIAARENPMAQKNHSAIAMKIVAQVNRTEQKDRSVIVMKIAAKENRTEKRDHTPTATTNVHAAHLISRKDPHRTNVRVAHSINQKVNHQNDDHVAPTNPNVALSSSRKSTATASA